MIVVKDYISENTFIRYIKDSCYGEEFSDEMLLFIYEYLDNKDEEVEFLLSDILEKFEIYENVWDVINKNSCAFNSDFLESIENLDEDEIFLFMQELVDFVLLRDLNGKILCKK